MAYYYEVKIASAQMHGLGCMSMIYVINITSSRIIPTFVGLDIYTLNNRDLFVIELNGKYPIISVADLRNIWN